MYIYVHILLYYYNNNHLLFQHYYNNIKYHIFNKLFKDYWSTIRSVLI